MSCSTRTESLSRDGMGIENLFSTTDTQKVDTIINEFLQSSSKLPPNHSFEVTYQVYLFSTSIFYKRAINFNNYDLLVGFHCMTIKPHYQIYAQFKVRT